MVHSSSTRLGSLGRLSLRPFGLPFVCLGFEPRPSGPRGRGGLNHVHRVLAQASSLIGWLALAGLRVCLLVQFGVCVGRDVGIRVDRGGGNMGSTDGGGRRCPGDAGIPEAASEGKGLDGSALRPPVGRLLRAVGADRPSSIGVAGSVPCSVTTVDVQSRPAHSPATDPQGCLHSRREHGCGADVSLGSGCVGIGEGWEGGLDSGVKQDRTKKQRTGYHTKTVVYERNDKQHGAIMAGGTLLQGTSDSTELSISPDGTIDLTEDRTGEGNHGLPDDETCGAHAVENKVADADGGDRKYVGWADCLVDDSTGSCRQVGLDPAGIGFSGASGPRTNPAVDREQLGCANQRMDTDRTSRDLPAKSHKDYKARYLDAATGHSAEKNVAASRTRYWEMVFGKDGINSNINTSVQSKQSFDDTGGNLDRKGEKDVWAGTLTSRRDRILAGLPAIPAAVPLYQARKSHSMADDCNKTAQRQEAGKEPLTMPRYIPNTAQADRDPRGRGRTGFRSERGPMYGDHEANMIASTHFDGSNDRDRDDEGPPEARHDIEVPGMATDGNGRPSEGPGDHDGQSVGTIGMGLGQQGTNVAGNSIDLDAGDVEGTEEVTTHRSRSPGPRRHRSASTLASAPRPLRRSAMRASLRDASGRHTVLGQQDYRAQSETETALAPGESDCSNRTAPMASQEEAAGILASSGSKRQCDGTEATLEADQRDTELEALDQHAQGTVEIAAAVTGRSNAKQASSSSNRSLAENARSDIRGSESNAAAIFPDAQASNISNALSPCSELDDFGNKRRRKGETDNDNAMFLPATGEHVANYFSQFGKSNFLSKCTSDKPQEVRKMQHPVASFFAQFANDSSSSSAIANRNSLNASANSNARNEPQRFFFIDSSEDEQ